MNVKGLHGALRVGALVVALGLVIPAIADARRPATPSEKRAIAGADARCYRIYVSTIDRRYASLEFAHGTYGTDARCTKVASDGIDVFHRSNGRWRDLGGMSDCPAGIRGVPARVYRELTSAFCR